MSETGSEPVVLRFEPSPKRVRAVFGGETEHQSIRILL